MIDKLKELLTKQFGPGYADKLIELDLEQQRQARRATDDQFRREVERMRMLMEQELLRQQQLMARQPGIAGGSIARALQVQQWSGPWATRELPVVEQTEPVVGYRCWKIRVDEAIHIVHGGPRRVSDFVLVSLTQSVAWKGPILRANGVPSPWDPHNPPLLEAGAKNVHGIYMHKRPTWKDFLTRSGHHCSQWMAIGEVEMIDTVVEHTDGYRGETVRIRSLVLTPECMEHDGIEEVLSGRYQCPVSFNPKDLFTNTEEESDADRQA